LTSQHRVELAIRAQQTEVMNVTNQDEEQPVVIAFRRPKVSPGTPEAIEAGCLCTLRGNGAYAVIHKDCPLHTVIPEPLSDVI
jgi:hypothetical protein